MAGTAAVVAKMTRNKSIELNNNEPAGTGAFVGGVSGGCESKFEKQRSLQDLFGRNKSESVESTFTRCRSNSDGAPVQLDKTNGIPDGAAVQLDKTNAIPSPTNSILDKMSMYGDSPRDILSEETLEQKFTSLALAFTIDSANIKDRSERQRRTRDQTESNFNIEVDKLKEKLGLLQPFCTDFERAELLSMLFSQVEILTKAASLVSNAAERYGAVQHEEKLTESVQLMVTHVQALRQQRDSARRQLQYTKRVLQEPIHPIIQTGSPKAAPAITKKIMSKRRASVDSVNLAHQDANVKFNRRISDLSFRATLPKSNRPSRLDLGVELKKIKEVNVDEAVKDTARNTPEIPVHTILREDSDFEIDPSRMNLLKYPLTYAGVLRSINNFFRTNVLSHTGIIRAKLGMIFNKWSQNDYLHAILNSCAVLCFSVSILTLVSLFLEQEHSKMFWFLPWNKS